MTVHRGTVVDFDEHTGLGTVGGDDGGRHLFHCTRIAGGSRTIPVGAAVHYSLLAAHGGRWEAVDVTPAP